MNPGSIVSSGLLETEGLVEGLREVGPGVSLEWLDQLRGEARLGGGVLWATLIRGTARLGVAYHGLLLLFPSRTPARSGGGCEGGGLSPRRNPREIELNDVYRVWVSSGEVLTLPVDGGERRAQWTWKQPVPE